MDDRLSGLAKASPNFVRLYQLKPLLSLCGALAETTVFTNANASLVHAGQFGEILTEDLITRFANAALFLCSDEARFITGVTLPVDAGTLIK
jgi:NAD(P)-dependent dehydrogenase (short-subunit alcohol dehydrogenase family)